MEHEFFHRHALTNGLEERRMGSAFVSSTHMRIMAVCSAFRLLIRSWIRFPAVSVVFLLEAKEKRNASGRGFVAH